MAIKTRNGKKYSNIDSRVISLLVNEGNCLGTIDLSETPRVGEHEIELVPQGLVKTRRNEGIEIEL